MIKNCDLKELWNNSHSSQTNNNQPFLQFLVTTSQTRCSSCQNGCVGFGEWRSVESSCFPWGGKDYTRGHFVSAEVWDQRITNKSERKWGLYTCKKNILCKKTEII